MKIIAAMKLLPAVIGSVATMNPITIAAVGVAGIAAGCFMLARDEKTTDSPISVTETESETETEGSKAENPGTEEHELVEDRITTKKHKKSIRRVVGKMLIIVGGAALLAAVGVTVIKWLHPLPDLPIHDVITEVPKIKRATEEFTELEGPINEIGKKIVGYSEETVKGFLRKLPAGQHASIMKIQEAAGLGIDLPEGYTIVDSFTRTRSIVAAA